MAVAEIGRTAGISAMIETTLHFLNVFSPFPDPLITSSGRCSTSRDHSIAHTNFTTLDNLGPKAASVQKALQHFAAGSLGE